VKTKSGRDCTHEVKNGIDENGLPSRTSTYLRYDQKGALHIDHGQAITKFTKKQGSPSQQTPASVKKNSYALEVITKV
jgi:hypothetical protein